MSIGLEQLTQVEKAEIATTIRNAGISGAGGAGFPAYAKWERLHDVDHLLINHQESEPNYYIDKWLGQEHAEEFAAFFEALLDGVIDLVVVAAKAKDRDEWMTEFEAATNARVYDPEDLPLDAEDESGVVFAYTTDQYEFGMETVILQQVADVVIGQDLPMDHGWLVQNTETLYNIYQTIEDGDPVTDTYLHVGGAVPEHRFLKAPIGTPATALLKAAGVEDIDLEDKVLLDGGPGWCFEIEASPDQFGVRKRTNCVLVADADRVEENMRGNDRVDIREPVDWGGDHETEPTATLSPTSVRVPLITNPDFEGLVTRSQPIVESGEEVSKGEMIAVPASEGVSNAHHASITGRVTAVTDSHIEIQASQPGQAGQVEDRMAYWTWCIECGSYVVMPDIEADEDLKHYVCEDCR